MITQNVYNSQGKLLEVRQIDLEILPEESEFLEEELDEIN